MRTVTCLLHHAFALLQSPDAATCFTQSSQGWLTCLLPAQPQLLLLLVAAGNTLSPPATLRHLLLRPIFLCFISTVSLTSEPVNYQLLRPPSRLTTAMKLSLTRTHKITSFLWILHNPTLLGVILQVWPWQPGQQAPNCHKHRLYAPC